MTEMLCYFGVQDIQTSSSAIAETARVTYLLSASLTYRQTAAKCADTQIRVSI